MLWDESPVQVAGKSKDFRSVATKGSGVQLDQLARSEAESEVGVQNPLHCTKTRNRRNHRKDPRSLRRSEPSLQDRADPAGDDGDLDGKSIVLSMDEIRHLFKHHGNAESEALRGQDAITDENFREVLSAIFDPDTVEKSEDKSGVISLVFQKEYNGTTTAVTVVSEKKKALTLKSAWITKNGSHISPPSDVQAPNQTPNSELSMNADPMDSIPQNSDSVNRKYSISEENPPESPDVSENEATPALTDLESILSIWSE